MARSSLQRNSGEGAGGKGGAPECGERAGKEELTKERRKEETRVCGSNERCCTLGATVATGMFKQESDKI